jgi:putative polyketide hydroxylase
LVFMRPIDAEGESTGAWEEARAAALVRGAIGQHDVDLTVRDVSIWHMTSQVAASYRVGRTFLAGDSTGSRPRAGWA